MKSVESVGGCLPSQPQLLFLKACILEPEKAVHAWQEWQSRATLDTLDDALYRMLPLLYYNLRQAGYDGADMARLKGIYRRCWYHNQMLFHSIKTILGQMQEASIPVLALKGAALAHLYYPDPNIRMMADGDLLVERTNADRALALLRSHGWHPRLPLTPNYATVFHAIQLDGAKGQEMDLHWRLFHECRDSELDAEFWRGARSFRLAGMDARTLSDSDHLFHTCIHGYAWNSLHSLRWVVDAHWILKKSVIDWEHAAHMAHARQMSLRFYHSLKFLREACGEPIPDEVLTALSSPVSNFERWEHEVMTMGGKNPSRLTRVVVHPLRLLWCKQYRFYPYHSRLRRIVAFPSMLRDEMRITHTHGLLGEMWRYLLRKRHKLLPLHALRFLASQKRST